MVQYFNISAIYQLMGGDGVLVNETTGLYRTSTNIELAKLKGESHEWRKALVYEAIRQYDPKLHKVLDKAFRRDKPTFIPTGEKDPITGADKLQLQMQEVARLPMGIQKYIIKQKASFARGNGVKLKPSDAESPVFKWVYKNWYENKTDNDLRDIFLKLKSETQCAVVYFADPESLRKAKAAKDPNKLRLKHKILSPLKGSYLYPYFDPETEALVALLREYKGVDGATLYDMYMEADPQNGRLKPVIRRFKETLTGAYTQIELPYPKLPLVYWGDEYVECDDSKELIEEMEKSFSDFADQVGYSADPILFGRGRVLNLPAKGSAGKFIEGSDDADLKYVTPDNATEARELHFDMLQKWIFSLNRAVVLDIDTMKNLGDISGAALDRMLVDVYAEATDNQTGYYGKGIQRMVNVQIAVAKDILGLPNDETTVDAEMTKYRINDMRENVEVLLLANGNRPLIDHQESITLAGLADDPNVAYERIQKQIELQNKQTTQARQAQTAAQNPASQTNPGSVTGL